MLLQSFFFRQKMEYFIVYFIFKINLNNNNLLVQNNWNVFLITIYLNYYNTKITIRNMLASVKSFNGIYNRLGEVKKSNEPLIFNINTDIKNQFKQIRIEDSHNITKVNRQIRQFINQNNIKGKTFDQIKDIVIDKIRSKRQEQSKQKSLSVSSQNCKTKSNHSKYQQNQKHTSTVISRKNSLNYKKISMTPDKNCDPKYLQICLNPKISQFQSPNINCKRKQSIQSFVFNSSFTIPSSIYENNQMFYGDQFQQNVFAIQKIDKSTQNYNNLSAVINSKEQTPNKNMKKPSIKLKKPENNCELLSPDLKKQKKYNITKDLTPKNKMTQNLANQQENQSKQLSQKKKKIISTRQRKQAIITPKKINYNQSSQKTMPFLTVENLEPKKIQQKNSFKELNCDRSKIIFKQDLIQQKQIPKSWQIVLQALFKKLTENNPSQVKQLNSQYVCYQKLTIQQLHFMGIIFEKVDHKKLNNLDFNHFRLNSLKYCWNQIEQMVFKKSVKHFRNISNLINSYQ